MACSRLPREFSSLLLKEELNLAKVMKREDSSMHILSKAELHKLSVSFLFQDYSFSPPQQLYICFALPHTP